MLKHCFRTNDIWCTRTVAKFLKSKLLKSTRVTVCATWCFYISFIVRKWSMSRTDSREQDFTSGCSVLNYPTYADCRTVWPASTFSSPLLTLISQLNWFVLYCRQLFVHLSRVYSVIVPDFCVCQFMQLKIVWLSLFFFFSIYFVASHPALGMPINRKRKTKVRKRDRKRNNYMNCSTQKFYNLGLL